ncbi:hypothetical protein, partial [Peloplasma aerotolerans]
CYMKNSNLKKSRKVKVEPDKQLVYVLLGFIMFLMMIDAFIQGSKDVIFIKYVISIFMIPVFFGLIGYTMPYENFKDLSFKQWFLKFGLRPLIAYLVALIIYTFLIYSNYIKVYGLWEYLSRFYFRLLLNRTYDAYFRLSLLLAIPFYSLIAYLFSKYGKDKKTYFKWVLVISIVSLVLILLPSTFTSLFGVLYVYLIEKNLMLYNMIFFALGSILRNHIFNQNQLSTRIIIRNGTYTLFALLLTSLFFLINSSSLFVEGTQTFQTIFLSVQTVMIYTLNIALLIQVYILIKRELIIDWKWLKHYGCHYQGIIVWYGLLIFISYQMSGEAILTYDFSKFYIYVTLLSIIFLILIQALRNYPKFNYYVFLTDKKRDEVTD